MIFSAWKNLFLVCALVTAVACSSMPQQDPDFASVQPSKPPPVQRTPGAIYQQGYALSLFEDPRARQVGDLLTIKLVEKTDASKEAETTIDRANETTVANPTLLGSAPQFGVPGAFPLVNTATNSLETNLSSNSEFDGAGRSVQSNSLTGDITVTVSKVLSNGNLVVQGEKLLTLNQGHEHIRFSGIVRPTDISSDNTVLSNQVGNARIIYAGQGVVADSNVMGWLSRFFLSIFFPF